MNFIEITLLTFVGMMAFIYIFKYCFRESYIYRIEEEEIPEIPEIDYLEQLRQHIENRNIAINRNRNTNGILVLNRNTDPDLPPKYEEVEEPPNYQQSNSS